MRFFLSIGTATRAQLGYDETIRFVDVHVENNQCEHTFEYDVYDNDKLVPLRTFRTVRCITDRGAEVPTGCASRIWEVVQVDAPGMMPSANAPRRVLKDYWAELDRTLEHDTMRSIRDRAMCAKPDDPRLRHFLTVLCAGVVPDLAHSPPCEDSRTRSSRVLLTGSMKVVDPQPWSLFLISRSSLPQEEMKTQPVNEPLTRMPSTTCRRHYRIVFEECGEVLRHSHNLPRYLYTLLGSLCGMRLMSSIIMPEFLTIHNRSGGGFGSWLFAPRHQ